MSFFYKVIVATLLLFKLVSLGSCFKCYICSTQDPESSKDPEHCADPFDPEESMEQECLIAMKGHPKHKKGVWGFCAKIEFKMESGGTLKSHIKRTCAEGYFNPDGALVANNITVLDRDKKKMEAEVHTCSDKELCNRGQRIVPARGFLLALTLTLMAAAALRRME